MSAALRRYSADRQGIDEVPEGPPVHAALQFFMQTQYPQIPRRDDAAGITGQWAQALGPGAGDRGNEWKLFGGARRATQINDGI